MSARLFSEEKCAAFTEENRLTQETLRKNFERTRAERSLLPIEDARRRPPAIEWSADSVSRPSFSGLRTVQPALEELVPYIDWTPFFHAWELKGRYPKIFDDPRRGERARELFDDAERALEDICRSGALGARGVYGFFPAASDGDDVIVYADAERRTERMRFPMLRQQLDNNVDYCLADFLAPQGSGFQDFLGAFAVTAGHGIDELVAERERDHDDYGAIMIKALADRLAEAFAEKLHESARADAGYGEASPLGSEELLRESYRGIRPAFGYPACPDHAMKPRLFELLDAEKRAGITLTESFAMLPTAAVSGLYFGHPQARYFAVGAVGEDQLADYRARGGIPETFVIL